MSRRIEGKVSVGWKSFQFHFHNFATLSTTVDHYIASPEFTCNGHQWEFRLYPGGESDATEGYVSACLLFRSEGSATATWGVKILDKDGNVAFSTLDSNTDHFQSDDKDDWGWKDFISRSDILDRSQNMLDSNGTLTVVVSMMKEPTSTFVPKNPLVKKMQDMFNDETTADACFEVVSSADEKDEQQKAKSSISFYAHLLILRKCAPMLAAICGSNDTASITDIKPDIFRHLLWYVYGGSVPEEDLKTHAKDIIDAADKYSIVNLKLEAEAAYVESTKITIDNAIGNLHYADTKNCALLKEAVMNFLAANPDETAEKISFDDVPGHLMKDLLFAVGRNSKKEASGTNVNELTTLCVNALRRKLDEMGLDVDGSREAMIESITSNS